LANIFNHSKEQEIKAPAVFVVGEVVNLRKSLLPS